VLTKPRVAVALAWLPAVLYMALIWTISSFALTDVSVSSFPLGDKGVHFVEYGVLALLLTHAAFRTWPRHHPLRTASLAVLITVLWGFVDEIHQGFVPGRSSEALDLVADTAGAIVGASVRYAMRLVVPRLAAQGER
jgi:VanZ family protein